MIVLGNRLCASLIYQIIVYLYCTLWYNIILFKRKKNVTFFLHSRGHRVFRFYVYYCLALYFIVHLYLCLYIIKCILCLSEFRFHNILDYIKIFYNLSLYHDLRKRCTDASLGKFIREGGIKCINSLISAYYSFKFKLIILKYMF